MIFSSDRSWKGAKIKKEEEDQFTWQRSKNGSEHSEREEIAFSKAYTYESIKHILKSPLNA